MANYDLGTARGTIELVYKDGGVGKAEQDMQRLTKSSQSTGQALDQVGGTAQKAGAAIGAGIAVAVKSAADFEAKMSAIKAVSGASGQEMDALAKKALQLGKDTSFSASEAATAIEELVKAGVSVPDVMNGAADATVALAAASGTDLKEAATIASDAMHQFQLSAQELPHVADVLAGAANASSVSVSDLGESLKYVGPVAHASGISIDETATALAILGNNGLKGSEAGTGLRGVLLGLTPTTDKQKKAFEDLGLITKDGANIFYDAQGRMKPLDEVIQLLNEHTKGLSDQEKQTFYETAFGRNSLPAAIALGRETSASFKEMAASMAEVSAAEVAATRLDNFRGALEQLKGSLETFMIIAGTPLLNTFRKMVEGLTSFFNVLLELDPRIIAAGTTIAAWSAGLLLVGGTIMKVISFIARFKEALITLGIAARIGPALAVIRTAMLALAGPVGIIIAAITALIAIFVALYKHNETFRNFVNGVASAIKDIALKAFEGLKTGVQAIIDGFNGVTSATGFIGFLQDVGAAARVLWDALKELWAVWQQTIWPMLKDAGSQIWAALKQAWIDMKPALVELWGALKELWVALQPLRQPIIDLIALIAKIVAGFLLWSAKMNIETITSLIKLGTTMASVVLPPLIKFATFIITQIIPALTKFTIGLVQVITKVVEFVTGIVRGFTQASTTVGTTVGQIVAKIGEIASKIVNFISTTIAQWKTGWTNFSTAVQQAWDTVKRYTEAGLAAVGAVIKAIFAPIIADWKVKWGEIKTSAQTHWTEIKNTITTAMNAIKTAITPALEAIKTGMINAWNSLKTNTSTVWNSIKQVITTVVNAIKTATSAAWNAIKTATSAAWNAIKQAISGPANESKGVVTQAWNAVKQATTTAWNAIKSATTAAWNAIKQAVSGPANAVKGVVSAAWNAVKSATTSAWNAIKSATTSAWNAIKQAITSAVNSIKQAVTPGINAVKTTITQTWEAIKGATQKAWAALSGIVKTEMAKVVAVVKTLKDQVVGAVKDAGTWLLQAGKDLVKGFIDGIQSMIGAAKAKVAELGQVAKQAAEEKLKMKSPSKVFFQYGNFTVQGYIDGVDSLMGRARSKLEEFMAIVKKAAQEKLKLGSPSKVFFQYGEWSVQGYIDGMEKLMPQMRSIMDELQSGWPQVKNTVVDAMEAISRSLSSVDIQGHVGNIISKLQPLSKTLQGLNIQDRIGQIARQLTPMVRSLEPGRLQEVASMIRTNPQLPRITVTPGQVTNQFPDKITLKVGDREFNAYVDERADALLGQAASLLSRGRK
jgi:TP901 family phage tail tape measure protein